MMHSLQIPSKHVLSTLICSQCWIKCYSKRFFLPRMCFHFVYFALSQIIIYKWIIEEKFVLFCFVNVQSNYEPLNRNNDCIGQWSWYYRGCWHQTCPPLEIQILDNDIRCRTKGSELLKFTAFQLSTQRTVELSGLVRSESAVLVVLLLNRYSLSLPRWINFFF